MNLQCKLNSVRATRARFQQPQRLLNTSENAAAGDAPHGQMSSNLPFDSSREILALDTSLMEIVSKDDTDAKSRSGDPSTCAINNQSWSDAARKVRSTSEKDSLYTKTILSEVFDSINAKEARSVSEEFTAGLLYKECSPDIHYGTNYVADNQKYCKSLHDSKLMNMMMPGEKSNEASGIRGRNSNGYSDVEKTPSPNSKISMFSAEIWTEKELPIEACIHPEPKMIDKTYLNNNRTTDELNCFTRCNTESRDIPLTRMDLDQEVFGQSTLISPPLTVRKSRTSSPCRKTINFDGEIWPVCSNLIPSGKELSFFTLGDKSVAASSKILNESDEKAPISLVFSGCAGTQGASSRSVTEQLVLEDSSKNKKQMKPTHEIEYQNFNMNLVETPQRYHHDTRNCCNLNSVTSTLGRTLNNNFPEASLKSQSSVEKRLKQESEVAEQSKQEMRKCVLNNSEACEIRNSQKNALTTSKNDPGNIVFGDVSKEEIINSLFCDKISPGVKCREKISSHKTNQKSNSQNLGLTMSYSACATSDQISFGPTNTYKLFEQPENYKSPIISSPVSKLPATELRNFSGSDNFFVEDRESVKIAKRLPEAVNDESRDKVELVFRNSSLVPDYLSVRSFNEEVNRSTGHISQQIRTDPALNNAVDTLTKIKMIVEANHHMIERLQYRHQNVLIPCLTPLDAGKSLAKALTRCRNYIRKNGESSEAINTVNKLLKIPVQNLKNSVERQKLALANLEKCSTDLCRESQSKKLNQEYFLLAKQLQNANSNEANHVKYLIANILTLTEQILPKLNGRRVEEKSTAAANHSPKSVTNFSKTDSRRDRILSRFLAASQESQLTRNEASDIKLSSFVASPVNKLSKTCPSKDLIIGLTQLNRIVEPLGNVELKRVMEPYESTSRNAIADTVQSLQNHRHYEAVTAFETLKLPISNSACTKKSINRCKMLLRNSTINNSTNNSRSIVSPQTVLKNQKLSIKKYGGNSIVQSSISDALNNERVHSLPLSSQKKKKYTNSEHARHKKLQLPAASMPSTVKNPANIVTKSVMKPYNTTSLAKMKTFPTRELGTEKSEVVLMERSNIQPPAEVSKIKARKPRSKSKTWTRVSNKIGRARDTEIPLEHTNDYIPLTGLKASVNRDFPLPKKTSSPKDIIQLLEELIKYSNHETSIPSTHTVPVVTRCNGHVKDTNESTSKPVASKVRKEANTGSKLQPSQFSIDNKIKESSKHQSSQVKISEAIAKGCNTLSKTLCSERRPSLSNKDFELHSNINIEEIKTRAYTETNANDVTRGYSRTSISSLGCRTHLSEEPNSMSCLSSKYCQVSSTSLASYEMSEEIISNQISDSILTSDGSQKVVNGSKEQVDVIENTRLLSNNRIQRFREDQNIEVNSDVIPKKKFAKRHVRALEMLKKILSDYGVSNERLSKAENKSRDRCRYDSIKRELSVTRSLDANLINQGNSDEIVSRISSSDRNFSRLLFSKLATLSESESDLHYMEVATMTSAKDLVVKTNDNTELNRIEAICTDKEDAGLSKVDIIENSTQFDINSKSDECLGDLTISDNFMSDALKSTSLSVECSTASYTSPSTLRSSSTTVKIAMPEINELLECELSNDIIEAFRLASIRAANLYAALDFLNENVPPDSERNSYSLTIQNTDDILTRIPTNINPPAIVETLCNANRTVPDHIPNSSEASSSDIGNRPLNQAANSKTIRRKISEPIMVTEKPEVGIQDSAVTKVSEKTLNTVKVSKENTTNGKSQTAYNHHLVNPTKLQMFPKMSSDKQHIATKLAGVAIDKKVVVEPQGINLEKFFTLKGKSILSAGIPSKPSCLVKEASQPSVSNRSITNKRLETLHFAGKTSNTGSRHSDTHSKSKCSFSNSNMPSKTATKVQDSIPGSRIKTLLEKNLQHFSVACNSMDDEMVCENEEDDRFIESSNDDASISTIFSDEATSTTRVYSASCYVIPEVTCILDNLLNEVIRICELVSSRDQNFMNTKSIQCCDPRKSQRKLQVFKCGRRSVLCGNPSCAISGVAVSRERILCLVYAVICSFVFFGLHFSVYCELQ